MTDIDTSTAEARSTGCVLRGINHVGLTVSDVAASTAWYERVLGLEREFEQRHYGSEQGGYVVVLATPDRSMSVGLDHHPTNRRESFDPTRTGLDHVCFHVASLEELQAWVEHLDAEGVANSGAYAMTGLPISLVTFRDPDGIQLELIAFPRDHR